jgi:tetratricopeptide (TPR) repeat protein
MNSDDWLNDVFKRARRALGREGGAAAAAELLSVYVAKRPEHSFAVFLLGDALREVGRFTEAEEVLLRSLSLASPERQAAVMAAIGRLKDGHGKRQEAEEWFRRATEDAIGASKGWIWIYRGCNLIFAEKRDEAAACHERATQLPGDQDEAYLNLGFVRRAQQRYAEAVEAFEKALALSPAYTLAAEALHGLRDIGAAVALAKSVQESRVFTKEETLDELRQWARTAHDGKTGGAVAAELLAAYVLCRPDDAYAMYLYGDALRAIGRFTESEPALLRALSSAPPKGRAHVTAALGRLKNAKGELEQAEKWFRRATEDARGALDASISIARGANLMCAGQFDAAGACYERAIELTGTAEAYLHLGIVRRAQRRYSEAIHCFEKAIELSPKCMHAIAALDGLRDIYTVMEFANEIDGGTGKAIGGNP